MKHPKPRPSHYIVVKVMFVPPQQFGWRIYQRGGKVLIRKSATGYATETDAWTAGSEELEQILQAVRRARQLTAPNIKRVAPSRPSGRHRRVCMAQGWEKGGDGEAADEWLRRTAAKQ